VTVAPWRKAAGRYLVGIPEFGVAANGQASDDQKTIWFFPPCYNVHIMNVDTHAEQGPLTHEPIAKLRDQKVEVVVVADAVNNPRCSNDHRKEGSQQESY
jgi:hypothetical protein